MHSALKVLHGAGPWEEVLRELRASDMTSLHGSVLEIDNKEDEEEMNDGSSTNKRARTGVTREIGEGYREMSWIWTQEEALGDRSDKALMQGRIFHGLLG